MTALITFLERHLFHSVLLDSVVKEDLTALLHAAQDELIWLEQRVAALESPQSGSSASSSPVDTGDPTAA